MGCKIFISTSGNESVGWTGDLVKTLANRCGIPLHEIYWYRGERMSSDIEEEVADNARNASVFLGIVTDEYLTSPWCVREHSYFCEDPSREQYARAVLAYRLTDWPESREKEKEEAFFKTKKEKQHEAIDSQFPGEATAIKEHSERFWAWLRRIQYANLRDLKTVKDEYLPPRLDNPDNVACVSLHTLIAQIKTDLTSAAATREIQRTDPERRALRAAAYLSAFALAADRYYDGGWGFSTAYDVDEEGQELISGRYDLNVVVLRALDVFLPEDKLRAEASRALGEANIERLTRRAVKDRLPSLAFFLACMERVNLYREELYDNFETITAELNLEPARRWDLTYDVSESAVYQLLLHESAFRAFILSRDNPKFESKLKKCNIIRDQLGKRIEKLENPVREWLSANNIFWDFVEARQFKPDKNSEKRMVRSILWCLLSSTVSGLQLLSQELAKPYSVGKWDQQDWLDEFQRALSDSIDDAVRSPKDAEHTLTFASVCAYILQALATTNNIFGSHSQAVRTSLKYALTSSVADSLLLNMNSLGWATAISLGNRILEGTAQRYQLDRDFLRKMWDAGRQVREERVGALSGSKIEQLQNKELQQLVSKELEKSVAAYGKYLIYEYSPERLAQLKDNLSKASFWGRQPASNEQGGDLAEGNLTGVLQVKIPSGKVDLESQGYSRLFLYPFSKLTEMNVYDLMGIRREIGERDTTLVEKMGAVVVENCYPLVNAGAKRLDFKERTDYITKELSKPGSKPEVGFSDLLKLRTGEGGFRWVYRTAFLQPEHGSHRRENSTPVAGDKAGSEQIHKGRNGLTDERTIAWCFTQMPERIASVLLEGLEADQRPKASEAPSSNTQTATA